MRNPSSSGTKSSNGRPDISDRAWGTRGGNSYHGLGPKIQDWREYFDEVEGFLEQRIEQSFATQGAAGGAGLWAPLVPKWAARKAMLFPGQGILVATGDMRSSLTDEVHPQAIRRKEKTRFHFGSTHPLVKIHGEGRGDFLPVRKILVLTDSDRKALGEAAREFIVRKAAEAGIKQATFFRRGRSVTALRDPLGRFT